MSLYVGPAQSSLNAIAPGLGLTVDYGWLTVIATPLFWLLSLFQGWVHNWGLAIILLTVLSLAPSILIMMTSFTRIMVVLTLLRQALGTQQLPPGQVLPPPRSSTSSRWC